MSVRRGLPPASLVGETVPDEVVAVPFVAVLGPLCCSWLTAKFSLGVVIFFQVACEFALLLSGEKVIPYRLPPVVN